MDRFKFERNGNKVEIVTGGNLLSVVGDIGFLIHKIYSGIKTQNEVAAMVFQQAIMACVTEDSPTWQVGKPAEGETMIAIVQED